MTENKPHKKDKNPHAGHHARMRERVLKSGITNLHDYELIEMLLHYAQPRKDSKPLAKQLLEMFGSFERLLHTDAKDLEKIKGMGEYTAVLFVLVRHLREKLADTEVRNSDVLSSWEAVIDYWRSRIGFAEKERFAALMLDSKNQLLHADVLAEGTIDKVAAYPREVASLALKYHARSVILVHNHPSGDTTPSRQDIEMTKQIYHALRTIDVKMHDHLIVSTKGHSSFKTLGLLDKG